MRNFTKLKLLVFSILSITVATACYFLVSHKNMQLQRANPIAKKENGDISKNSKAYAKGSVTPKENAAKATDKTVYNNKEDADKDKFEDPDEKGGMNKKALVEGAFKLEFQKTRDLTTNTVPKHRLLAAARYADDLKNIAPGNSPGGNQGPITGLTWVERGPNNIGGRTRAILPDLNDTTGNTVWAGSVAGGLWKTTNALNTTGNPLWKPVNDLFHNLAISSITQNATKPGLIYFGTGEGWYNIDAVTGDGIWKSADSGKTWNQLSSTEDTLTSNTFSFIQKVLDYTAKDTEYLFACTGNAGVQLSKDGGQTWKKVLGTSVNGATVNSATDIERGADGSLYASLGIFEQGGIYKSTNNGSTWTKLTKGLPTSGYQRIALACAPSDSMRVYALIQDASTYSCKGVYRSDSSGKVWYAVTNPTIYGGSNFAGDQAWYALTIGVDPKTADRIIVGGLDLTASKDGGHTWTTISQWYGGGGFQYVHADHHAIVYYPTKSSLIYFGNDGGLFISKTGQNTTPTITQIDSSYNVTQFYHAAVSPVPNNNYMIAGAQDNGNIQFTKAGMNPGFNFTGGDGAYVHIDDDLPQTQIAAYVYSSYYISTNGFVSKKSVTINGGNNGLFINPTDYDSRDKTLYGSDNADAYHVILNVGTKDSTHIYSVTAFNGGQIQALRVSPNKRRRVFFGLDNGELFMVDSANLKTPVVKRIDHSALPLGGYYFSCIAVEPGNDNHLVVCFSNFGLKGKSIWETKNGGSTWASITGNLPDMPVRSICFKPYSNSSAVIGTDLGVWSTDSIKGASTVWGESNTGLARVSTDWVDYRKSDGTLFAATHGRGLFTSTSLTKPVISYVKSDTTITRTTITGSTTDCRSYKDISIPVQLSSNPSASATVQISASSASLISGIDYQLLTTANLVFSTSGKQTIKVRIYNTAEALASDSLHISLSLVNAGSTNAIITPFPDFNSYTIFINNAQSTTLPVQTTVDTLTTASQFVGPKRTVYFYDGTPAARVIASIKNNSSVSLGCIKVAVDRAGDSANVKFNNNDTGNYLASKTIKIISSSPAASGLNYTLTLYYSNAEITKWAAGSGRSATALKIIEVKDHEVRDVTPATPYKSSVFVKATTSAAYTSSNYAFSATLASIDSLQGFGIGDTTGQSLPVTLLSFKASMVKGNALLTWKTATEINNKGFEIERSSDGQAFTTVSFVNGSGTTNIQQGYQYIDNDVPAEITYYRIKQIDLDGSSIYSNIVAVSKGPGDVNAISATQNPFHSQFSLAFKGTLTGNAYINVFDIAGRKVYTSSQNVQSTLPVNIGNLSSGVYMVSVLWNNKIYTIRVVKN